MIEGHYVIPYEGGEEMLVDLLAEKPNSIHCFSEDTEILTPTGWKFIKDLSKEDLVSQWDNNNISFVKPSEIINRFYNGPMISIKSKKTDQLITPEHRVIHKDPRNENWVVNEAKDFINFKSARNLPKSGKILNNKNSYELDFIRLLVAVQADAYLMKDCSGIRFQFHKTKKRDRLIRILNKLNIKFTLKEVLKEEDLVFIIYLNSSEDTIKIRSILNEDKSFPDSFYNLSFKEIETIVDEVQYWDGTVTSNGDIVLDSTSKQTVEVLQTLCHLIGLSSQYSEFNKKTVKGECYIYRCYISKTNSQLTTKPSHYKEIEYTGNIVCVTVPSGFIMVKRNNKIFISGNCKNARKLGISRDNAKSISYGLLYGAGVEKVQKMLDISFEEAQRIYDEYWNAVPALKALREDTERFWESTGKLFVIAGDGRRLMARSKHSLLNLLFQSLGSLSMKYSYILACQELDRIGKLGNLFNDTKEQLIEKANSMIIYHR